MHINNNIDMSIKFNVEEGGESASSIPDIITITDHNNHTRIDVPLVVLDSMAYTLRSAARHQDFKGFDIENPEGDQITFTAADFRRFRRTIKMFVRLSKRGNARR